jgi:hypothetical protein
MILILDQDHFFEKIWSWSDLRSFLRRWSWSNLRLFLKWSFRGLAASPLGSRAFRTRPFRRTRTQTKVQNSDSDLRNRDFPTPWPKIIIQWYTYVILTRAFRTRPFRRTRTQPEVRNSDSDSGSDIRNRDFPTPWPKIISQWNTYDILTIVDICACGL